MSKILNEEESGLKFGTQATLTRAIPLAMNSAGGCKVWIKLTGSKCAPVSLTFDRAGYNHYDEMFAYCFKLPDGEEVWFEFLDTVQEEERICRLKNFLDW